jgi:hypothetical protein
LLFVAIYERMMQLLACLTLVAVATMPALAAGPFDGTWSVLISCDTGPDGARGYNWRFDANVLNSQASGSYNQGAAEATGALTGKIQPDGNALLTVRGKTGRPEFSLKAVKAGSPIYYTLASKCDGGCATGQRNEGRSTMTRHRG